MREMVIVVTLSVILHRISKQANFYPITDIVVSKPKVKSVLLTTFSRFLAIQRRKSEKFSSRMVANAVIPNFTAHVSYTTVRRLFSSKCYLHLEF